MIETLSGQGIPYRVKKFLGLMLFIIVLIMQGLTFSFCFKNNHYRINTHTYFYQEGFVLFLITHITLLTINLNKRDYKPCSFLLYRINKKSTTYYTIILICFVPFLKYYQPYRAW